MPVGLRRSPSDKGTVQLDVPPKGDCNRDAMGLLARNGYHAARVIRVEPDAILWIDQKGDPRTTFVRVEEEAGKLRTSLSEPLDGFLAA